MNFYIVDGYFVFNVSSTYSWHVRKYLGRNAYKRSPGPWTAILYSRDIVGEEEKGESGNWDWDIIGRDNVPRWSISLQYLRIKPICILMHLVHWKGSSWYKLTYTLYRYLFHAQSSLTRETIKYHIRLLLSKDLRFVMVAMRLFCGPACETLTISRRIRGPVSL